MKRSKINKIMLGADEFIQKFGSTQRFKFQV